MITVQIKVKWYDYWTKKYGPKQHHYSSIVGENTKLDTDEYKSDGVFCLKINADWKVQPKEWFKNGGGNNGIYSGANCRQYLQFWDGKKTVEGIRMERKARQGRLTGPEGSYRELD